MRRAGPKTALTSTTLEGTADLVMSAVTTPSEVTETNEAVRTCIGCRKVGERLKLIRLVRFINSSGEMEALVDVGRRLHGRGAWLHPLPACWTLAIKRRAIGRALPGITNVSAVEAFAQDRLPLLVDNEQPT